MKLKIVSLLLVIAMLCATLLPISAAKKEEFISDVALVYEDNAKDAREAIEGTDWNLFDWNLNAKADYIFDNGVYLIYKTTTNVEEAITDLRVMDMYGGYSSSNYERQLEKSRKEYLETVGTIRIVADEFKTLYEAGDPMAILAYRQMNLYKDVKVSDKSNETNMLMGDFMLNIPNDAALVQILMEGNALISHNLLKLLAIGISKNADTSLSARIAEMYAVKDTLSAETYNDDATMLAEQLEKIAAKITRYDALEDEYDFTDPDMTDEEFQFVYEYASLVVLLEQIPFGETNLADLLRSGEWTLSDLYPLAAALSEGQKALASIGMLESVLKYSTPSKPIDELNEAVDEAENNLKNEAGEVVPVDVYLGVDRSIFDGTFAMTTEAERQQAMTGKTWDMSSANEASTGFYIASGVLAFVDLALWGKFVYNAIYVFPKSAEILGSVFRIGAYLDSFNSVWAWSTTALYLYSAIGVALIAAGLSGISTWYNYYNPDYTEIPNVMIDVRETDTGDKYIKYDAAKVFGDDDKNADFNAYEGKEWIALYYTKDANAGNCLLPKFTVKPGDSSISRRYQGVSMFGETTAFNLNSHVYNADADSVYLSVRYSTAKKAAADVGDVIGSMFATGGLYFLTAASGIGAGMGLVTIFQKKGKKRKVSPDTSLSEE